MGIEIFQYQFMVRAIIAGCIVGAVAPLLGNFLVARRFSLIADTLAHVSLAGIALGLLLGVYPIFSALVVTLVVSFIIESLRESGKVAGDAALAMFLSGGLALAVVLIGIGRGFNVDIFSYLFGSISTVEPTDIVIISVLGLSVLASILVFYKQFLYLAFDEEGAKVSGLPTKFLNILLTVLTALTVSLSIRIVGALLIGALMVIPVVTAMQLKLSFKLTCVYSVVFGLVCVLLGLIVSFYLDLAAGGTIVLLSLLIFAGVSTFQLFQRK